MIVLERGICNEHSGCQTDINNIKKWQDDHPKEHENIWTELNKIKDALNYRLPLWATFLIAFLSSLATWGLTH